MLRRAGKAQRKNEIPSPPVKIWIKLSLKKTIVMPAQAGIQRPMSMGRMTQKRQECVFFGIFNSYAAQTRGCWIPAFAGMTHVINGLCLLIKLTGGERNSSFRAQQRHYLYLCFKESRTGCQFRAAPPMTGIGFAAAGQKSRRRFAVSAYRHAGRQAFAPIWKTAARQGPRCVF
jgi:hypothetical protein